MIRTFSTFLMWATFLTSTPGQVTPSLNLSGPIGSSNPTSQLPGDALAEPGDSVQIRISSPAVGAFTAVFVSPTPPPVSGVTFQGRPLGVDWTNLTVLWNGFVDPNAPRIPPSGNLVVPVALPFTTPLGTTFHVQALVGSSGANVLITEAARLVVVKAPTSTIHVTPQSAHPLATMTGTMPVVIENQNDWAAFWALHQPLGGPAPTVDFVTSVVVAAFLGPVPYGGSLTIVAAYPGSTELHVYTLETVPGIPLPPNAFCSISSFPRSLYFPTTIEHRQIIFAP